jgi:hypothetical protein
MLCCSAQLRKRADVQDCATGHVVAPALAASLVLSLVGVASITALLRVISKRKKVADLGYLSILEFPVVEY